MSETQVTHTPGPWAIEDCTPGESTGLRFAINSKDNVIARTTDGWKEAQANARLIAAAPELHEVLSELLETLELSKDYGFDDEYEKVRSILDKVEGGTAT